VLTIVPSAPPALLAAAPPPASSTPVSPAFKLTSAVDPFLAWVDLFNTTQINYAAIVNEWNDAPVPVLQQLLVNWAGYVEELPNVGEILDQIVANGTAAADALFAFNEDALAGHDVVYLGLTQALPELKPLIDYTTTYSSGILMGAIGTFLSPWLAFGDSVDDIVNYLFVEPDIGKALNTFLNIPADWLNGFFNGYDGLVNLDFLIDVLPPLPGGVTISELGLKLGGLFSPAGSLLGATDITAKLGPIPIPIPGVQVGPLASWIAQGKVQAEALGWSGEGNPVTALLPGEEESAVEEEAPAEETPAEEPVEVAEAATEETPAEEPVEIAEAEETPAEEPVEIAEAEETPAEEPVEIAEAAAEAEAAVEEAAAEETAAEETPAEEAVEVDEAADDSSSGEHGVSDTESETDSGADSGQGDADAA
ncbi:MAG: hypothetical protein K0U84_12395, partial [Actinomycetia bacterium]|nr:hypothetical protein [Actinomycetes bacterium]